MPASTLTPASAVKLRENLSVYFDSPKICDIISDFCQSTTTVSEPISLFTSSRLLSIEEQMEKRREEKKVALNNSGVMPPSDELDKLDELNEGDEICPSSRNKYNSILLQRLTAEAKLFESDYKYPFLVRTINELKFYEDDDRLINSFAKKKRKSVSELVTICARKYLQTGDPELRREIATRLSLWSRINKIYFNGMRCDVCTQTNGKKCRGCGVACYCSVEHQKLDYLAHAKVCGLITAMHTHHIDRSTDKFGKNVALRMVNNVWGIATSLSSDVVTKQVLSVRATQTISSTEEARENYTTGSTLPSPSLSFAGGREWSSGGVGTTPGDVVPLLVLHEWLETHHAPCMLTIECADGKSMFGWIDKPSTRMCLCCKSKKSMFCRLCTMVNSCEKCHPRVHSKEKCALVREMLNSLVRRTHYRRNLFGVKVYTAHDLHPKVFTPGAFSEVKSAV